VPLRTLGAGYIHMCGVNVQGRVVCWGDSAGGKPDVPP
jgi:hypothetical protein